MNNFERDVANAMLDAADKRIRELEDSLAKYQAARVHDVDEKEWLRDRVNVLQAKAAVPETEGESK